MTAAQILDITPNLTRSSGYKVDPTRGERISRVSSEWFSRPDDQRYLSLSDLHHSVRKRADHSRTRTVETNAIRVEATRDNAERMSLILPEACHPVTPTHWSFGQLSSIVGAPAAYLRQLPAPLAAINLQYGLTSSRTEQVKTLYDPLAAGQALTGLSNELNTYGKNRAGQRKAVSAALKFKTFDL